MSYLYFIKYLQIWLYKFNILLFSLNIFLRFASVFYSFKLIYHMNNYGLFFLIFAANIAMVNILVHPI